jgi:heat shock protein HtpX
MMNLALRYFIFLASVVIGPSGPVMWSVGITVVGLVTALALRRSFQGRTIVLLGILVMMLADGLLFVLVSSHIYLLGRASIHMAGPSWNPFSILQTVNLGVAVIGGIAAACVGLFISFKSSRIGVSKMFPRLDFLEMAPVKIKETVKRLSNLAGVTPPEVWLVDSGVPSAFTVCANRRYSVALSIGLLESLDDREIEACIAHEISHLKNGDFTVRLLATLAKVALFAKPLSYLIEPAIYRAREFLADRTAAGLIGGPDALISALSKLKDSNSLAAASPQGLACVCNLGGGKSLFRLLDKQPDLVTRIKTLQEMKRA